MNGSTRPRASSRANTRSRGIGASSTPRSASFRSRFRISRPSVRSCVKVSTRTVPRSACTLRFHAISSWYFSRSTNGAVFPLSSIPKCSM